MMKILLTICLLAVLGLLQLTYQYRFNQGVEYGSYIQKMEGQNLCACPEVKNK